ncbi:MAG: dihydrofolate reductase [Maricaulis sp.]|nr:dihydrofolate reductase [Maricaulis sp.]
MPSPKLCLIAARGRNGVIGAEGDLPWRLSSDLKHFKATTKGKPVIMGRKTWESLPFKPLPGRTNVVVTRQAGYAAEGAQVFTDLDAALAAGSAAAQADGVDEVFVIGGAQIYAEALHKADRLYLTDVEAEPAGEAVFPAFEESAWHEIHREAFAAGEGDDHAFIVRCLEKPAHG